MKNVIVVSGDTTEDVLCGTDVIRNMDNCPHCIHFNESGRCTHYDEECNFEPTKECKESDWWKWMNQNKEGTGTIKLEKYNKHPSYPTSRICCICNKYEYPESDVCTTATWVCEDCLKSIRRLVKIEGLLDSVS